MISKDFMMIAMRAIIEFESLRLTAYVPIEGDKLTIGFGSTVGFMQAKEITLSKAYELLIRDMVKIDKDIDRLVMVNLLPTQRAAVMSLIYNVGVGSFKRSRALSYLNSGKIGFFKMEAFDKEKGWVRVDGKVIQGLVNRRAKEQALFEVK
jgi:lysozyme